MIIGSIIMLTCAEAPDVVPNPGPGPGPNPDPKLVLTDEERMEVLKECSEMVDIVGDLKQETAQQVLVAWLKSRPEFVDAGAEEGSVWANFHDGRMAIFVPNWLGAGEDDGGRISTDPSGGRTDFSSQSGRTQEIPGKNKVELYLGLGKAFLPDRRPYLKSLFDRSHTGYKNNVELKDATIENLKNVRDVGVFHIFTHGGIGFTHPRSDSIGMFGLYTMDTCSLASERTYLPELNSNMLVYMNAVDDDRNTTEWHYAITSKWVSYGGSAGGYMTFAKDAFFYIDACNGMSSNARQFRTAMIGKTPNGKGTYIGWTAPTSATAADPAARFILDRLLGVHDQTVPMEDPVQRPFDVIKVFDDMRTWTNPVLGVSEHGGRLDYFSVYTTEPMLTPSIEYIWTADFESSIYIRGMFGEQTPDGKVTVDGVAAAITLWSKNLIIAEIPTTGQGSSGDVIVSVRGNESNNVPLTEWTIPLTVSSDAVGATTEANLNLKIRADVHKYRTKPGEQPRSDRPELPVDVPLPFPNPVGFIFHSGSTGTYSVGGERLVNCNLDDCTLRDRETFLSRSGLLPYLPLGVGLGFKAFYKWSPDMTKIYVKLTVDVPDVSTNWESYTACPNADPITVTDDYLTNMGLSIPTEDIPYIEFKLDENYKIQSGHINKTRNFDWGRCPGQSKIITDITWQAVTPKSPPKTDTDARIGRQGN